MPDDHKNFAYSAIATAPSPPTSGTSLVVAAGQGSRFPVAPFNCTVWPTGELAVGSNAEIVRVTAIATDTLTITRMQEGSSARSILVGDQIAATITDKTLTDIEGDLATGLAGLDTRLDTLEAEVVGGALTLVTSDVTLATVTATASETTAFTYALPGGTLGTNGLLRVWTVATVQYDTNPGANYLRMKYGGSVFGYASWPSPTVAGTNALWITAELAAAGATGAQVGALHAALGPAGSVGNPPTAGSVVALANVNASANVALAVDSTAVQNLDITFQPAQGSHTFRLYTVHVVRT